MTTRRDYKKIDSFSKKTRKQHPETTYTGFAQVQNVKSARVYVFSNNGGYEQSVDSGDDEDIELYTMPRSRYASTAATSSRQKQEPIIFERQISEGDSLCAIALQYSCSMSDLKRVNHLMTDQDFFALRTIRIPIKPHSIISESLPKNTSNSNNIGAAASASFVNEVRNTEPGAAGSTDDDQVPDNYLSDPEIQDRVIRTISIRENTQFGMNREAREFLHSMDRDLEKIRKMTPLHKASLDDVRSVLTSKSIHPLYKRTGATICGYQVPWYVVVCLILLLVFIAVPTCLFLFRDKIFPIPGKNGGTA